MDNLTRRRLLVASSAGVAGFTGLAGCFSRANDGTGGTPTGTTTERETTKDGTTQTMGETESTTEDPGTESTTTAEDLRWTFETEGAVHATPLYHDDTVYVGSEGGRVYALDAATGEEVWRYDTGNPVAAGMGGKGALVIDDGTLYAVSGENAGLHGRDYAVHAIDAARGEREWTAAPKDIDTKWFSLLGIADGAVHVGTSNDALGDSGDPTFALDAASGETLWTVATGDVSAAAFGDGTAFVAAQSTLYALGDDGENRWTYDTPGFGILPPAFDGRNVYSGTTEHDQSYAVALDPESGEGRWRVDDWTVTSFRHEDAVYVGGEHVISVTPESEENWRYTKGGRITQAPITDEMLFGSSSHGVFALRTADGSEQWRKSPPAKYATPYAAADGTVVLRSNDSRLFGLDAATGEQHWTFSTSSKRITLPEIGDGTVFAGSQNGTVYAHPL